MPTNKKLNRIKMKKITCIIFLMMLILSAYSQQFLWSTAKDSAFKSIRHISVDNVLNEVLEFYQQYEFYLDGSGYSKEGFFKTLENPKSFQNASKAKWTQLKKKIYEINDLTVFAFKDNSGHGSRVLVVCVTKNNIDMLIFSNNYHTDAVHTYAFEKEKFIKWFKSFVPNQVVATSDAGENGIQNEDYDKVFTKVENEAQFPGGNAAWARYLEKALGSFDAKKKGAAAGKYQVIVRFIVNKDGTVTDVIAETNYGYDMEEIAVKIIQDGPKWKPGLQNGRNVNSYRRQPVNFTVDENN